MFELGAAFVAKEPASGVFMTLAGTRNNFMIWNYSKLLDVRDVGERDGTIMARVDPHRSLDSGCGVYYLC